MLRESMYYTKSFRACRKEWARNFHARKQCFDAAKTKDGYLDKWKCAHCEKLFAYSECQCDHIAPIQTNSPASQSEFILAYERLHVEAKGLQVLCKKCHYKKTQADITQQKQIKLMIEIEEFHKKNDWFPFHDLLSRKYTYKCLKKIQNAIKKIDEFFDGKNKDKYKKKLIDLIKSIEKV